jgi:pimeloyl-ACP methyl ester carboxylesterase
VKPLLDASFNKFFNRFIMAPLIKLLTIRIKEPELIGMKGQLDSTRGYNSLDRLPLIKTPTLVLAGTKDRVVKPESSNTLSQKIPNAKLVKIENGSHMICWEVSKVFNKEVLDFLKST